ncbi:MAG: hypothetical protein QOI38_425 [Sphingomonadales bacterium]|jgi:hypothetical protein|nr:hypothetical protein [Sphingomonadales bacterium]
MKPKGDSYQDRVGRAAEAKKKALDQLRAKPALDPEAAAARSAEREARDAARAEKREAAAAAKAEAKARADEAAAARAPAPQPTEEERKAARDARYAARKSRR